MINNIYFFFGRDYYSIPGIGVTSAIALMEYELDQI